MFDDAAELISRVMVYAGTAAAAVLAFVEAHHQAVGLFLTAIGIFGGLALNFWHKRRIQKLREMEIMRAFEE